MWFEVGQLLVGVVTAEEAVAFGDGLEAVVEDVMEEFVICILPALSAQDLRLFEGRLTVL